MKKIVVINGHPYQESFNTALAQSYIQSAESSGSEVRYIAIGELDFEPNLRFGYQKRMELEPDLLKALEDIHWSEHQVWIHPMWWLGMPAVMKGFFDRELSLKAIKKGLVKGSLMANPAELSQQPEIYLYRLTKKIINQAGSFS